MKKITITLAAATVAILLLFTGCDKYHRDRYVGYWDFVTEKRTYSDDFEIIKRDTINYLGKISNGKYENEIIIHYTNNDEITIHVDTKGNLYSICEGGYCKCGNFTKKDKIYFNTKSPNSYDISETHYVNGIKK